MIILAIYDDFNREIQQFKLNKNTSQVKDLLFAALEMGLWGGKSKYNQDFINKLPDKNNEILKSLKDKGIFVNYIVF